MLFRARARGERHPDGAQHRQCRVSASDSRTAKQRKRTDRFTGKTRNSKGLKTTKNPHSANQVQGEAAPRIPQKQARPRISSTTADGLRKRCVANCPCAHL